MDSQDLPQPEPTLGNTAWWTHDRFGLFIHWGIYALAARHEWVKKYEEISDADYQPYFDHFDPDLYDPAAWARSRAGGRACAMLSSPANTTTDSACGTAGLPITRPRIPSPTATSCSHL